MPAGSTLSHEIAEILRVAFREALSELEQLGIIAVLPGGTRVRALSSESVSVPGPLMA